MKTLKPSLRIGVFILGVLFIFSYPVYSQNYESNDYDDPFIWLEEIEGEAALHWVEQQNKSTLEILSTHPWFEDIQARILDNLNSEERIPFPNIMGEYIYNFWQNEQNPRGVWRRTTWDSYLSVQPDWEIVLNIDALVEDEGINWAYAGSICLSPDYDRCLIRLSRGGADAVEIREFDTREKSFIQDGFFLPEAKQSVTWFDENTLLVATDFCEGSMTTSGYARIAKMWSRGTDLAEAKTLFEGDVTDVSVSVGTYRVADRTYSFVRHRPSFFEGTTWFLLEDELLKLDIPDDAFAQLLSDQLIIRLRSPWQIGDEIYPEDALIAADLHEFLEGEQEVELIYVPGDRSSIRGVSTTQNYLLVNLLTNVRTEIRRYSYQNGTWSYAIIDAPELETVFTAATSYSTDRFFVTRSGYATPATLSIVAEDGTMKFVRSLPDKFNTEDLVVRQLETNSKDGTSIPYFIVHKEGLEYNGTNPALLYAYGGFAISQTPNYNPNLGAGWLERGGVYVLANIRGGGEFGTQWHRSAQRENRQRAYDDFIAVAERLIESGITSPQYLGIQGGSNGGLLVGAAFTQRPDLFGAVVCSVPLLDMYRYHKLLAGASWMAEYGNPDNPDDWAFISKYSPYQNLRSEQPYPRVLFTTTTRDDRVHPGHARKMAAKMIDMGYEVFYFENTEGGHGSGVTNEQRALMSAITYTYLWNELGRDFREAKMD